MFHVKHAIRRDAERQLQAFLRGCELLRFSLVPEQIQRFRLYLELLLEWNQRVNLFAPGDAERLAERHLLESVAWLRAFPSLFPDRLLDVGTGAGFPGLPIAILMEDVEVILLDSRRKKVLFLNQVVRELGLTGRVHPVLSRVEELHPQDFAPGTVPLITARAVAPLEKLVKWTLPLLPAGGKLVTFKGDKLKEEIHRLSHTKNALKIAVQVIDYSAWCDLLDRPREVKRKMIVITKGGEQTDGTRGF